MDLTPAEREDRSRIPENLLTELLTIKELAILFNVNRNKMAMILKSHMAGAVRFGSLWRLPVAEMPPQYFEERSISLFDATNCNDLHKPPTADQPASEN